MASQALKQFEIEASQPFMLRDILPGPGWAPYTASGLPPARRAVRVPQAGMDEGSCIKGTLMALGLEGAAALGTFGLWQIWHFIR